MPRSIRSARSNSICSNASEGERSAKLELLASRVKMGKKGVEKGLNKEKNQSATSQDETDSNKALEPYTCIGQFSVDLTELCRRNNLAYVPPVVMRPRPPVPQAQQDVSPVKGGGAKGKTAQAQPEPEPEETTEEDAADAPPKTFSLKDKFEYFKPCIQVEMDNQDKADTVTEIFIRGWKVDTTMMDMFVQCWPTMEKLHSLNFWNTGLNSETLHTFASIIPQCPNIKNVTLDGNTAEEENWYELVTEESPIQNLSLRHCGITNKGAIMIGRCLGSAKRGNKQLISLNLSNNKIGDEGLQEIAQGLRMNRSLLSLSLASNEIGDKGVVKLGEVLSRFPLTHEEVVERRRQQSDRSSPDRNKSPPLSRRADSKDRPGSVRSSTHQDKKKGAEKISAKGKKDAKGKDDKDEKHDKTKGKKEKEEKPAAKKGAGSNVGGRSSGASLAADAKGKLKGGKGKNDKGKPAAPEHEVSDSPDFINPLLEGADFIDGQLWVAGNRVLLNLNLSRNQIGESGMAALIKAIQYQSTIMLDSHSGGTGLMRLLVGRNKLSATHDLVEKINNLMIPKDPFYKPPPQTPEVET